MQPFWVRARPAPACWPGTGLTAASLGLHSLPAGRRFLLAYGVMFSLALYQTGTSLAAASPRIDISQKVRLWLSIGEALHWAAHSGRSCMPSSGSTWLPSSWRCWAPTRCCRL